MDSPAGPLVAVAVDRDKSSQTAFKWALDNIIVKGQTIILIHVNTQRPSSSGTQDDACREIFVPFRCFCSRKDIQCKDVLLEDTDVAKAIVEFVSQAAVEKLVVGASSKGGFVRSFRTTDVSTSVLKNIPDFCTVYVISKGKISTVKNAVRAAPPVSTFKAQLQNQVIPKLDPVEQPRMITRGEVAPEIRSLMKDTETIKSPFTRGGRVSTVKPFSELVPDSDISFVSSGRSSFDHVFPQRMSNASDGFDRSFEMPLSPRKSTGSYSPSNGFSSFCSDTFSTHSVQEDVEAEMNRLRLELKQTMDMYSNACKEALSAKQKAMELHRWKMDEERRLQESRLGEETALAMVEREKAKCRAALEAAEASKRIAELEAQKRINAEMKALKEAEEREKAISSVAQKDLRYRKYTIDEIELATENFADSRKIGEGGYGPVYRCYLDHTPVAVKVLRPDAAQGREQFQQEVEILSCIRHPNMVLLLGACPEYGCLVYEYMANGSLEDRLFRRGNTPSIPWQHRFRIAAEIGTGLLFLHQTKPEPLVHRDLKPANILLDRNYVSKISDVGLARLVPPSVAENVTQYRMTSAAGTFCYIDPEYQQTGMLGIKSDVYSLGIMLLQIITAKPPMGIAHHVDRAIEKGTFAEMLDPSVPDWPVEEAVSFAKMAVRCAELRRKDRPDLGTVVLPELNRLRILADESTQQSMMTNGFYSSPIHSQYSTDFMSGPTTSENSRSLYSGSSIASKRMSNA